MILDTVQNAFEEKGYSAAEIHDKDAQEWEDIKQEPDRSGSPSSLSTARRARRRVGARTIYVVAPSIRKNRLGRNTSTATSPLSRARSPGFVDKLDAREEYEERGLQWEQMGPHLRPIAGYFIRVVGDAFRLHRPLFSLALALCMAYFIFAPIFSVFAPIFSVTRSLTHTICAIPIVNTAIPFCAWSVVKAPKGEPPKWADYPKLVEMQSSSLERLLDESAGGSALALEVKKAEMATSDLVTLVRVSDLRSKDSLSQTLVDFLADAKKTGRGLQTLSAKINGAVDTVLAVNDYALKTIEAASTPNSLMSRVLSPLSIRNPARDAVIETFEMSMSSLSNAMQRCILEAQISLADLDRLEEHLSVLHEIVVREDASVNRIKYEVLSELWTLLGGNKGKLQGLDSHLLLLKGIGEYRKRALAHVVATLQTLTALNADMEELRSRVAAPELVGDKIPLEVHMKSIRGGLERLRDGRMRAREREDETIKRVLGINSS